MEIDPVLPVVPDTAVLGVVNPPVIAPGVVIDGAVIGGTLIAGAVTVGVDGLGPTAPAGPDPIAIEAMVPMNPSASTVPTMKRRHDPWLVFRLRGFPVTVALRLGDAQRRVVRSRSWSSIAFHDGVGPEVGPGEGAVHWPSRFSTSSSARSASPNLVIM